VFEEELLKKVIYLVIYGVKENMLKEGLEVM
jgi:hypothetical protein